MQTDERSDFETEIVAKLSLEMWKLLRSFERTLADLPEQKRDQRDAQLRYSRSRLDNLMIEAKLRLLTFDGATYTVNLPVSPLNADDFDGAEDLIIESTVEPAIVSADAVLHVGKVLLEGGLDVSRN
jgi:hypothetical protein